MEPKPEATIRQQFGEARRAVTQPPDPQQIETRRRREESEGQFTKLARKFSRHLGRKEPPENHAAAAASIAAGAEAGFSCDPFNPFEPFNPFGDCGNTCSGMEPADCGFDSPARPDYSMPDDDAPGFDFG